MAQTVVVFPFLWQKEAHELSPDAPAVPPD